MMGRYGETTRHRPAGRRYSACIVIAASVAVAAPARADGAGTVAVAAATAGLTAVATYLVKDYFDGRAERKRIQRETEDALRDAARLEKTAAALEAENEELKKKVYAAAAAAAFWAELVFDDQDFFKPPAKSDKQLSYERGLELLYIRRPDIVAKVHNAMAAPPTEYERYIITRAYGGGLPGADFGELTRRIACGIEGGVVKIAGEDEPRYVSGAENLLAVVDYVKALAGDEYPQVLKRLWGLTDEEMDVYFAVFPQ